MACIWATHLELTWGVFAARALVNQMTKWAMRVLKHKICHRLASITLRSRSSRSNHSITSPDDHRVPPYSPTSVDGQTNDPQTTSSKTPSRDDIATRNSSSKAQSLPKAQRPSNSRKTNISPSTAPKRFSLGDVSDHVFSWNERPANEEKRAPGFRKVDGSPTPTSGYSRSKAIAIRRPPLRTIIVRLPPSTAPALSKEQDGTGSKHANGPISSPPKKPLLGDIPAHIFSTKAWVPIEKEHRSSSLLLRESTSLTQSFSEGEHLTDMEQRPKSNSENDQPLHQEPAAFSKTPDADASLSCPGLSAAQNHSIDTPTPETNNGEQGSSFQGEESSSSDSDGPLSPTRRPGSLKPAFSRYHI